MSSERPPRTPDERLRVFVSSTLEELARERTAVREAIERLRLTPVLFELGARDRPPQDVYQAYLDRSDVFVGVYGERYGWVGPGMEISGLEDEYRRSAGKPRLLYVKSPARGRDARLARFIEELMTEGAVSFKTFRDEDELRELVENDLAFLLSERFVSVSPPRPQRADLPARVDELVARNAELRELRRLLTEGARLVTVTGTGGVGKTRLALELARQAHEELGYEVHFVDLSAVPSPELVASTILDALDAPAAPGLSAVDALVARLREREALLVLDNFEHVVEAAPDVARLISFSPSLRILVTSRSLLRLRAERELPLAPLAERDGVRLFVDRARSAASGFELTERNRDVVAEICRRLDGLPLAIELAAARVRALPVEDLLPRLEEGLAFLTGGGRDYPERQRTLQATIDWSFSLLEADEKEVLARASVFRGGWTLAAAEAVCQGGAEVLGELESLLEKSLIRRSTGAVPRFTMLETVREYAASRLGSGEEARETRARHARFYLDGVDASGVRLRSAEQSSALEELETENDNVRLALDWSLEHGDADAVAAAGWSLMPFWWLRGHFEEAERVLGEALEAPSLSDAGRANALLVRGFIGFWKGDYVSAIPSLRAALAAFATAGDRHKAALATLPLAAARAAAGDHTALDDLEESRRVLAEVGDEWGLMAGVNALCWALNVLEADAPLELFEEGRERAEALGTRAELATALGNLSRRRVLRGEHERAKPLLADVLRIVGALGTPTGIALYGEMTADLASREGDHVTALELFAGADALRTAAGADVPAPVAALRAHALARAGSELPEDAVAAAQASGEQLSPEALLEEALAWLTRAP